jgi:hypothetical protein
MNYLDNNILGRRLDLNFSPSIGVAGSLYAVDTTTTGFSRLLLQSLLCAAKKI